MCKIFAVSLLIFYTYGSIIELSKEQGDTEMKKFEVGKEYSMKSVCDQNCVWTYTVTARTAQTVTITDGRKVQKCRINQKVSGYRGAESIFPLGQYSMAPILTA